MLLAFGIVLIVTGAAVDSLFQNPVLCRFAEDTTCYAAVGQRLELPFPQGYKFILKKSESSVEQVILKYRKGTEPTVNPSGWNFVTDIKTVIISGAKKNDSGTYRLEISQQDGKTRTVSLQLNVEDSLFQNPVLCRFAEDTTCYAAVGQRLELPFPQGFNFILMKSESSVEQVILRYRKGTEPTVNPSGWNFVTDIKTVIISGAKKHDSGTYRLEISQQDGKTSTVSLHLNVEDSLSQNPVLCRFAEDTTCYAAVGQRLELTIPQGFRFILKKSESSFEPVILKYRTNQGIPPIVNPSGWNFFTDNNTVIISGAKKHDSGTYRLEISQQDGKTSTVSLQLNVEVPVSSVDVSYSCFPPERSVSCTAEGDELHFYWTSPSQQLNNRNSVLPLDELGDINVTCHVENHVSSGHKTIQLQKCPEPTTPTTTSTTTTAVNTQTQSNNGTGLTVNITETYNHSLTHTSNPDSKTFPPFLRFNVFVAVWLFEVIILLSLLVGAFYIYTRIYKKQRAAERENQ